MAGTLEGGRKAAATNKLRWGNDYYVRISRAGGKVSGIPKGFSSDVVGKDGLTGRERAKIVGVLGGKASRKTKKVNEGN